MFQRQQSFSNQPGRRNGLTEVAAAAGVPPSASGTRNTAGGSGGAESSSPATTAASNKIEVVVRARPFLDTELAAAQAKGSQCESTLTCLTDTVIVDPTVAKRHNTSRYYGMKGDTKGPKRYGFDAVLGPRATQGEVYSSAVRKIALDTFNGKNGSVLAYGATGSGKTHTMLGNPDEPGIVFQVMADILRQKDAFECMGRSVSVKVAHYEIYNELVHDLFTTQHHPHPHPQQQQQQQQARPPSHHDAFTTESQFNQQQQQQQHYRGGPVGNRNAPKRPVLQVQETACGAADLPHLKWCHPQSMREFETLIELSVANRATGETAANQTSSRSHAILTIEIETRHDESSESGTVARLKLCDLAGSERAAANVNQKQTFKEGANINKSLLALGAVVQALATKPKATKTTSGTIQAPTANFVPYRGSKLTRLLKDCLGGNCNTVMLICIAGHPACLDETNNTLGYAMYAKKIEAHVKSNDYISADVTKHLQREIDRLQQENEALKEELKSADMLDVGRGGGGGCLHSPHNNPVNAASPSRIRHSGQGPVSARRVATTTMVDSSTDCYDLGGGGGGGDSAFMTTFLQLQRGYTSLSEERLAIMEKMGDVSETVDAELLATLRGLRLQQAQINCGIYSAGHSASSPSTAPKSSAAGRHQPALGPPSTHVARVQGDIAGVLSKLEGNAKRRIALSAKLSDVDEGIQHIFESIACSAVAPFNTLLHKLVQSKHEAFQAQQDLSGFQKRVHAEHEQRTLERDITFMKVVPTLNRMATVTIPPAASSSDRIKGEMQLLKCQAKEALIYTNVPTTYTELAMIETSRRPQVQSSVNAPSLDMGLGIQFNDVFKKLPGIHDELRAAEASVQELLNRTHTQTTSPQHRAQHHHHLSNAQQSSIPMTESEDSGDDLSRPVSGGHHGGGRGSNASSQHNASYTDPLDLSMESLASGNGVVGSTKHHHHHHGPTTSIIPHSRHTISSPAAATVSAAGLTAGFRQRWKAGAGSAPEKKDPHAFVSQLSGNSSLGMMNSSNPNQKFSSASPIPKTRTGASKARYAPGPDVRQQRPAGTKEAVAAAGGPAPFHRAVTSVNHLLGGSTTPAAAGRGKENLRGFR